MDPTSVESTSGIDSEYPDLDGDEDVESVTGMPDDPEDNGNSGVFQPLFDVTVGRTLVENRSTGEKMMMYEARCSGENHVDTTPTDAAMGVIVKANKGEMP